MAKSCGVYRGLHSYLLPLNPTLSAFKDDHLFSNWCRAFVILARYWLGMVSKQLLSGSVCFFPLWGSVMPSETISYPFCNWYWMEQSTALLGAENSSPAQWTTGVLQRWRMLSGAYSVWFILSPLQNVPVGKRRSSPLIFACDLRWKGFLGATAMGWFALCFCVPRPHFHVCSHVDEIQMSGLIFECVVHFSCHTCSCPYASKCFL